jgi:uncharacterized membrane-anchored protein
MGWKRNLLAPTNEATLERLSDRPDHYESLRWRVRWFWLIGTGQIVATIALVMLIAQFHDRLAAVIFVASLLIYWTVGGFSRLTYVYCLPGGCA